MRLSWRAAAITSAVVLTTAGAGVAVGQSGLTDRRVPSVSEKQAKADLPGAANSGKPFHFESATPPANLSAPIMFGPYRLVPWGTVGDLPQERRAVPEGFRSGDLAEVKKSPLYSEPSADTLPANLKLTKANTWDGNSETSVYLLYESDQAAAARSRLEVWVMRPTVHPINVDLKREDQGTYRTELIDGAHTAVLEAFAPPVPGGSAGRRVLRTEVHMARGDLDVMVTSPSLGDEALIRIANSVLNGVK